MFPILFIITIVVGIHLTKVHKRKESTLPTFFCFDTRAHISEAGFVYLESDMQWTPKLTTIVASLSLGAGILASLLGIGKTTPKL